MRIAFVDNLLFEDKSGYNQFDLQPHVGLISLIAIAESAGHVGLLYDPKLGVSRGDLELDGQLYRRIAGDILRLEPDAVGLTALGCNFICTAKVASHLKAARPDMPVLLGGPHATVLDKAIMARFSQFDAIVRNEAELTLLPVLEELPRRSFGSVPGVTYRRGSEVVANPGEPLIADLDALPWPAYDRYPIRELGLTTLRVDAGRGCPFHCTFCSTASFFGRKYRLKSALTLREQLERLHREYGVTDFSLMHDLFTVNRKKVLEFCDSVRGSPYTWKCSARMDCVDPELLEAMYESGCRGIYYGIEAGTMRMQELVQKKLDLDLFDPTLDKTQALGMSSTVSFITGYPQEEQADQDGTLDLLGSCYYRTAAPLSIQLHLLTPEPGTQMVTEFARGLKYDGYVCDFNFPSLEDDDSPIMEENPHIFMNHHYFDSVIERGRHVFVTGMYPYLAGLGPPVLSHLLDFHDRRLSILVEEIYRNAGPSGSAPPYDGGLLVGCLAARFGEDHYLISLVRYMIGAMRLARRLPGRSEAVCGPRPAGGEGDTPHRVYALSPRAAVLRDLHNAPAIIERIERRRRGEAVDVPGDLGASRGHFLLLHDGSTSDRVRNFQIDDASTLLFEALATPRLRAEFLAIGAAVGADPEDLDAFLEKATGSGIVLAREAGADLPATPAAPRAIVHAASRRTARVRRRRG